VSEGAKRLAVPGGAAASAPSRGSAGRGIRAVAV
jgi:hypothetical protein